MTPPPASEVPAPAAFHYVYILQSQADPARCHIGFTENLPARLARHNSGADAETAPYRPWLVKNAIAFRDPGRAGAFERYLKSTVGRTFAQRHF